MHDFKDRANPGHSGVGRRWKGRFLVAIALAVLVGGLIFLALDAVQVRSEREDSSMGGGREPEKQTPGKKASLTEPKEPKASTPAVVKRQAGLPPKPAPKAVAKALQSSPPAEPAKTVNKTRDGGAEVAEEKPKEAVRKAKAQKKKQVPDEPHYDFYTLLPEYEVIIPEEDLNPTVVAPLEPLKPVELKPGTAYLLQLGSFRTEAQAEDSRGRLALLGFEASIHESENAQSGRWFRVRIGPYGDQDELNDVRSLLQAEGFNALAIRVNLR